MSKDSVRSAAEMLRKGGALVKEACVKCKGVQVRYQGRLICINCGNETVLEEGKDISLSNLKGIIVEKVNSIGSILRNEDDITKQMDMARLLLYYLDILSKIKESDAERVGSKIKVGKGLRGEEGERVREKKADEEMMNDND
jgi:Sjogren''s syndrome/scleroderma autoantigen 1 (Autoantigen p27).